MISPVPSEVPLHQQLEYRGMHDSCNCTCQRRELLDVSPALEKLTPFQLIQKS